MESLSPQDLKAKRDAGASVTLIDLQTLQAAGYTKVFCLAGGMMGWMEAGYGIENGAES